jgi:hypothetical protein
MKNGTDGYASRNSYGGQGQRDQYGLIISSASNRRDEYSMARSGADAFPRPDRQKNGRTH